MAKRIVIVQGHPDPAGDHYGHALARAYHQGATEAGHKVEILPVAEFEFPLLRTKQDFNGGDPPPVIRRCQEAIARADRPGRKLLKGKSARVVVTMGMPGFAYRWFYGAHAVKGLERNILAFTGFRPIHRTLIGMVEARGDAGRKARLAEMRKLGKFAQ